jgi:Zn-dependent M28 family amino/carboxypeptidase
MEKQPEIPVFSDSYKEWVEILSSENFEGRAPTTPGGKKTKAFIEAEFRKMGLKPANNGSFRQTVPLIETTSDNFSKMWIKGLQDSISLSLPNDFMIGSVQMTDSISLENSNMVFVGYGIVAPEYNWNDYEGIDVRDKTVVILVNDPGYELQNEDLFTGRAMTYYGRWTYKFEEAARQGAAAALIVHETDPASYGWDVVRNSWSGPQYRVGGNNNQPFLAMQGWIQSFIADSIFQLAGYSLDALRQKALSEQFVPVNLSLNLSVAFTNSYRMAESDNIVGYVEGSVNPQETVIYMAHWDHLGKTETADGVQVYPGAIDNATGTAAIMAIAEKFAAMDPPPARSVVFMALTAEESGLIGSEHYALNPLFEIEKTAGGINIDGLNVYGPTHDISVVGYGNSSLQDLLEKHARDQNRSLVPEKYPERGGFYRSDHFNLVKVGVPMIYANSGDDYIGKSQRYVDMVKEDVAGRYHSVNDVINNLWNWKGIDQNLWLFFNVGKDLANSRKWPVWNEGMEFKALREESDEIRN